MLNIEKARAIRDHLLVAHDAAWEKKVADGVEHPCWRIRGNGWNATMSSVWEILAAGGRSPGLEEGDRHALIGREILELHVDGLDENVLAFTYDDNDLGDYLYAFIPGEWERHFAFAIAAREARSLVSTSRDLPVTGLKDASPIICQDRRMRAARSLDRDPALRRAKTLIALSSEHQMRASSSRRRTRAQRLRAR